MDTAPPVPRAEGAVIAMGPPSAVIELTDTDLEQAAAAAAAMSMTASTLMQM